MAEILHYILHKEMKTLLNDIMPSASLTDNLVAICNTYFQKMGSNTRLPKSNPADRKTNYYQGS